MFYVKLIMSYLYIHKLREREYAFSLVQLLDETELLEV